MCVGLLHSKLYEVLSLSFTVALSELGTVPGREHGFHEILLKERMKEEMKHSYKIANITIL